MRWRTAAALARHELKTAARSGALGPLAAAFLAVFGGAAALGLSRMARQADERSSYQAAARADWLAQPDRHPHRVAHFGSFAFRPASPLGFFDPGLDSYAGTSVYLEAHKQNPANLSDARLSPGLMRLGDLTMGLALQSLVPLALVFLLFSALSAERERGTLALLLVEGARPAELATGKLLGALAVTAAAAGVPLAAASALLWAKAGGAESASRVAVLLAGYGLYYASWAGLCLSVSALARSSRAALVVLLSVWCLQTAVLPRVLPNAAQQLHAAPSKPEFERALQREVLEGGDGHDAKDARFAKLKEATLARFGVKRVEDLPVNFAGIAMAAGEEHSAAVYDRRFGELLDVYRRQNAVTTLASLAVPYLAVRSLSMAASGTDFAHYADFLRQAEAHRMSFVQGLNTLHAVKVKAKDDKNQRLGRETWSEFPGFEYRRPGLRAALAGQGLPAAGLAFAALLGLAAAWWSARRAAA